MNRSDTTEANLAALGLVHIFIRKSHSHGLGSRLAKAVGVEHDQMHAPQASPGLGRSEGPLDT